MYTRRSKEQIASLLKLYENHTGTTRNFCKQHNLSETAFYVARRRYSVKAKEGEQQGTGFTALTRSVSKTVHTGLFAEVGETRIYQRSCVSNADILSDAGDCINPNHCF